MRSTRRLGLPKERNKQPRYPIINDKLVPLVDKSSRAKVEARAPREDLGNGNYRYILIPDYDHVDYGTNPH